MLKSAKSVLFLTVFIDLLGYGVVIPLLPEFARNIGATALMVGVVVASYSAMQFVCAPVLGGLSDRFGRRPVLLATIALNGAAYVMFGFVESVGLLLLSRMLAGTGGANLAVAQAYLSDITPPAERTKAFGMIGAALGLGFVFGPPLGGFITAHFGGSAVGWFIAGLCAVNFVSAFFILPETRQPQQGGEHSAPPLSVKQVIKGSPAISKLFLAYFFFTTGFGILTVVGSLLWIDRFGLSASQVGLAFGLIGATMVVVQTLVGKIVAVLTTPTTLVMGLALMAASMGGMPFVPARAFVPVVIVMIVAFSMGYALALPTGTAMVADRTDASVQGKVLGLYQATGSLARVIGPLMGGAAYAVGPDVPFVIGGLLLALACAVAWQVTHRQAPARPC